MNNKLNGLEELHITKREDGKGFVLQCKATCDGAPCTINIPYMRQPNLNLSHSYGSPICELKLNADFISEDGIFYSIAIDPEYQNKMKILELEKKIEQITYESKEKVKEMLYEIETLKKGD